MAYTNKVGKRILLAATVLSFGGALITWSNVFPSDVRMYSQLEVFEYNIDANAGENEVTTSGSTLSNLSTFTNLKPTNSIQNGKRLCPILGIKLVGPIRTDLSFLLKMEDVENHWSEKGWVEKGGAYRPRECQAICKVAIIIPYRNRYQQLKIFLRHMHPFLKRQLLDYRIFVIEQSGTTPFNRAILFNIGYNESLKFHDFQCFVFHDVDLLPEDDRNYYGCPSNPRHLSVAIDKFGYRLPYTEIFGGAVIFTKRDFEAVNGFSNQFWGWGGEDDDLYRRVRARDLVLSRPRLRIGRYRMVKINHHSAKSDPKRYPTTHQVFDNEACLHCTIRSKITCVLVSSKNAAVFQSTVYIWITAAYPKKFEKLKHSVKRMAIDGLNSLKYDVVATVEHPFYTNVEVKVNPESV